MTGMAVAALCAISGLAGCSPGDPMDDPFADYAKRINTVSETAGNTQAANTAIQTIDPWPRYVHDTHIPGDGVRMSAAYENYEKSSGSGGAAATTGAGTGSSGAVAPP